MRVPRRWKIASLLSAVLLLAGGDLCMLVACHPSASRQHAAVVSHSGCGASGAGHQHQGADRCTGPCHIALTLASAPELSPPPLQGSAPSLFADLAAAPVEIAAFEVPLGAAPPGASDAPTSAPAASRGIRAPPIA